MIIIILILILIEIILAFKYNIEIHYNDIKTTRLKNK